MKLNPYFNLQYKAKIKSSDLFKTNKLNSTFSQNIVQIQPVQHINVQNLSSKFNINFTSNISSKNDTESEKELDRFCEQFANKIKKEFLFSQKDYSKINSPIKSSSDISYISRQFQKDGITNIVPCGISLGSALNYLAVKKQLNLASYPLKSAFILDELSLNYLEQIKNDSTSEFDLLIDEINKSNISVYCINLNDEKQNELIEKFSKITGFKPDVKAIKTNFCKNNFPSKNEIKELINVYLYFKCGDDNEAKNKLQHALLKYLDETSLFISYPKLCLEMKNIYQKIKKEVEQSGKSMDDVYYIIPLENKSYDLINYLFAFENNIESDKLMSFSYAMSNFYPQSVEDRTFVVLDDLSLSGYSASDDIISYFISYIYKKNKGKHLIFAPVVYTNSASDVIERAIKHAKDEYGANIKFIEGIKYNSIGQLKVTGKKARKNISSEKINKALENFETLTKEDINYLLKKLTGGYGEQYVSIFLPYMIPDNSSDISTLLGAYFLNHDSKEANKGIAFSEKTCKREAISYDDYSELKKQLSVSS